MHHAEQPLASDLKHGNRVVFTADPNSPGSRTFRVFRDPTGMYRWTLTDQRGQRMQASRCGFAAPAGAFRDIEALRAQHGYESTLIRDETGR